MGDCNRTASSSSSSGNTGQYSILVSERPQGPEKVIRGNVNLSARAARTALGIDILNLDIVFWIDKNITAITYNCTRINLSSSNLNFCHYGDISTFTVTGSIQVASFDNSVLTIDAEVTASTSRRRSIEISSCDSTIIASQINITAF